jgi:hypothetical protein
MEGVTPTDARFSDQIRLLGYDAPDVAMIGSEVHVTLYWEAIRPPDGDYVVFVHLVGADGQPVTSHDGVPMQQRYPTGTWIPGDVVPDMHPLPLKPDALPGTHTLHVGMYSWPNMQRLPVQDRDGVEQPGQSIALQSIEVR